MENNASENIQQIQETNLAKKPNGIFQDGTGDFSSGRFVKVFSFFVACILAGFLTFTLLNTSKDKPADPNIINAIVYVSVAFLGVSTGSEIVQKITNH